VTEVPPTRTSMRGCRCGLDYFARKNYWQARKQSRTTSSSVSNRQSYPPQGYEDTTSNLRNPSSQAATFNIKSSQYLNKIVFPTDCAARCLRNQQARHQRQLAKARTQASKHQKLKEGWYIWISKIEYIINHTYYTCFSRDLWFVVNNAVTPEQPGRARGG